MDKHTVALGQYRLSFAFYPDIFSWRDLFQNIKLIVDVNEVIFAFNPK